MHSSFLRFSVFVHFITHNSSNKTSKWNSCTQRCHQKSMLTLTDNERKSRDTKSSRGITLPSFMFHGKRKKKRQTWGLTVTLGVLQWVSQQKPPNTVVGFPCSDAQFFSVVVVVFFPACQRCETHRQTAEAERRGLEGNSGGAGWRAVLIFVSLFFRGKNAANCFAAEFPATRG